MLSEILKALLITSLAGSCLTAVITVTKPITKKVFGYAWHYYIWLAVLAVMILPVRFTMPQKADFSSVTVQTIQTTQNVQTVPTAENAGNIIPNVQTEPKTDIWQTRASLAKRIINNRLNILAYLWLVGAIMMLLINLIGYIRLIIKMRKNSVVVSCPQIANFTRRKVTARVWENTSSPFMTGIFKPTLVLPAKELTEEQLCNILRHEMTHFKRHDILYKWCVTLVKCLHWFNPVIWYVAKQINTECEISCDMAVTLAMNKTQEMSYIDTVLALLPTGKTKQIPLTTQMASSKRVLKRRFEMIRNKRKTSKFVSALSAVIAVVMLGTTVFASGVLSDLTTDDYTIEITNNGEKIELANKPFIENGEVYLPLRELFEKVGVMEHPESSIVWNNGKIDLSIAYYVDDAEVYEAHKSLNNGQDVDSVTFIFNHAIEIDKPLIMINTAPNLTGQYITSEKAMYNAPILRGSNTYIPYSYIRDILDTQKWNIDYAVYDKSGNLIDRSGNGLRISETSAENFNAFSPQDIYDLADAQLIVGQKAYSILDKSNLTEIEDMFSNAEEIKFATGCPFNAVLKMTRTDGTEGVVILASDSCAVYKSNDVYYDYSDGDNSRLLSMFGTDIDTLMNSLSDRIIFNIENLKSPEETINGFFAAFSYSDFTQMKNYCTESCISNYFRDGYVFGMTAASLAEISIDPFEYAKSSNDFNVFVTVYMTPHENSVFDPSQTSTSFYVILQRQPDGRYLIDQFVTGL